MSKKKKEAKKELFITKVIKEIKLVRWPNKKEMLKYSIATLACIIILSVFFVASDFVIAAVKSFVEGL